MKKRKDKKDNNRLKRTLMWALGILIIICFILGICMRGIQESNDLLGYTEFKQLLDEGKIDSITLKTYTTTMDVKLKEKDEKGEQVVKKTLRLSHDKFMEDLLNTDVKIEYENMDTTTSAKNILYILPNLLMVALLLIYIPMLYSSLNGNKSKTKSKNGSISTITFKDVAGLNEEKAELESVVDSFKNADKYKECGGRPIKGVLLTGPPGTGKTLLAQAVAGEAGVNFLSYAGSDFVEMFVGRGASRVRSMFDKAKRLAPCVIFIDEIDQLGRKRSQTASGSNQESDQTLVAMLDKLQGADFDMSGILLIGATNKPDFIDDALLRPGRIDKVIEVGLPRTKEDRAEIVALHSKNKKLADDVTIDAITDICYGMSGAEIEMVLTDAVGVSFTEGCNGVISISHIDKAYMKLLTKGVAKKKPSKEETYRVAVHEAGHAIVDLLLGRRITKISIIPYSSGLGGVTIIDGDSANLLGLRVKEDYINDVKTLYGGVIAEKLILGNASTGCSNDIDRATRIIDSMYAKWGMCDTLLAYSSLASENPLITSNESYLDNLRKMSFEIEQEVTNMLSDEYNKEKLIKLAELLMVEETVYDINNIDNI